MTIRLAKALKELRYLMLEERTEDYNKRLYFYAGLFDLSAVELNAMVCEE